MEKNKKKSNGSIEEKLTNFSSMSSAEVFEYFDLNNDGLDGKQIEEGQEKYGPNVINTGNKDSVFTRLAEAIINPFNIVLLIVAAVTLVTDVIIAAIGWKIKRIEN